MNSTGTRGYAPVHYANNLGGKRMNLEALAEIRNANVCMVGIFRKLAERRITETQAIVLIGKEIRRQITALKELKEVV